MPKAEQPRTLSEEHFKFIDRQNQKDAGKDPRVKYKKSSPLMWSSKRKEREQGRIRQKYQYVRDVAKKEMLDLARLALSLNEKQQEQLFSPEVKEFRQLFSALFNNTYQKENSESWVDAQLPEEKRKRILQLCDFALWEIGERYNAMRFAKDSFLTLKKASVNEYYQNIVGIKAIMIQAEKERRGHVFVNPIEEAKRTGTVNKVA